MRRRGKRGTDAGSSLGRGSSVLWVQELSVFLDFDAGGRSVGAMPFASVGAPPCHASKSATAARESRAFGPLVRASREGLVSWFSASWAGFVAFPWRSAGGLQVLRARRRRGRVGGKSWRRDFARTAAGELRDSVAPRAKHGNGALWRLGARAFRLLRLGAACQGASRWIVFFRARASARLRFFAPPWL